MGDQISPVAHNFYRIHIEWKEKIELNLRNSKTSFLVKDKEEAEDQVENKRQSMEVKGRGIL